MKKFVVAAVAAALVSGSVLAPKQANAAPVVVVPAGSAWSAGASWTAGFIGVVCLIAAYDLVRRTTCSGDFLGFGGPGFDSAIKPTDNVLPPQCKLVVVKKKHRR